MLAKALGKKKVRNKYEDIGAYNYLFQIRQKQYQVHISKTHERVS